MSSDVIRRNPLVIDPDDCDPLFDDIYEEEQELRDDRGVYDHLSSGAKRRKPAINDEM